jgi:hypothetical protein
MLADIEAILYGDTDTTPSQPSIDELASFLKRWARFIVIDYGNGTWSATSTTPGQINMIQPNVFEIVDAPGEFIDADTYNIRSSPRTEDFT